MIRKISITVPVLWLILLTVSCQNEVVTRGSGGAWLIPAYDVHDGGPGRDGIPALTNPTFVTPDQIAYLSDDDLVIGIKIGDEIRAYPHPILDWHEIINDKIGTMPFAITYCPLTGSGIAWDRIVNGRESTFGVSGLLYNTNLIPYDRSTNSNWSQMRLQCVNGSLIGDVVETVTIVETTWRTWRSMYLATKVVSVSTGYSRPYGQYPYGDYKTNHELLLFPITHDDNRLSKKERVHGVIVGPKTKVYRINSFPDSVLVVNDTVNGNLLVVAGSSSQNLIVSFERTLPNSTVLTFTPVQGALPAIMIDDEGTTWDVFGNGLDGPRAGAQLRPTLSFNSFWFAWGTFYRGAEIYMP